MRNYLYKANSARIYMLFKFYRTAIIQNEYTIIIAESGLHTSYNDNFQKTVFNLFELSLLFMRKDAVFAHKRFKNIVSLR